MRQTDLKSLIAYSSHSITALLHITLQYTHHDNKNYHGKIFIPQIDILIYNIMELVHITFH